MLFWMLFFVEMYMPHFLKLFKIPRCAELLLGNHFLKLLIKFLQERNDKSSQIHFVF